MVAKRNCGQDADVDEEAPGVGNDEDVDEDGVVGPPITLDPILVVVEIRCLLADDDDVNELPF